MDERKEETPTTCVRCQRVPIPSRWNDVMLCCGKAASHRQNAYSRASQGKVLRSQAYNDDTLIVNLMTASASFAWEPVLRARYTFAQSAAIH